MDSKKDITVNTLRKKVCELCRSRAACKTKPDSRILFCPVVNNYKSSGVIYNPVDDLYT